MVFQPTTNLPSGERDDPGSLYRRSPGAHTFLPEAEWHKTGGKYGITDYRTMEGGADYEDYLQALKADWAARGGAMAEQEAFQREGLSELSGFEGALGKTREATEDVYQEGKARQPSRQGREAAEESRGMARTLGERAEERRQQMIQAQEEGQAGVMSRAEQAEQEALGGFRDTTDAQIAAQSSSVRRQAQDQVEQIRSEAVAAGMDPDDPAVQDRIDRVQDSAANRVGNIARDVSVQHNQTRAQLQQSYDNMELQLAGEMERLGAQTQIEGARFTGLAERGGVQEMARLAALESQLDELDAREARMTEQNYLQNRMAADQLELRGRTATANYLRNMESFVNPVADLIGLAASMSENMRAGNEASLAGANAQVGATAGYSPYETLGRRGTPGPLSASEMTEGLGGATEAYDAYSGFRESQERAQDWTQGATGNALPW